MRFAPRPNVSPHPLFAAGILGALLLAAACAGSVPSLDQPQIRNKLDLRLKTALGGSSVGETLGEYIRVLVRLESEGTGEDLELLNNIGATSPFNGAITTMTLEPSRVVDLAALERVAFIELESPNAPKPDLPPPPPSAGDIS